MPMVLLLAAVLATASTPPAAPAPSATAQATATIRVITGVRLTFNAAVNPGAPAAHDAVVRQADGASQPAKLIEFQ